MTKKAAGKNDTIDVSTIMNELTSTLAEADAILFSKLIFDIVNYYNNGPKKWAKEKQWNEYRKELVSLKKKILNLREAFEGSSYALRYHLYTTSRDMTKDTEDPYPIDARMIFPDIRDLNFLMFAEEVCDKTIVNFGGEQYIRRKKINTKVRVVCFIAEIFHRAFIVNNNDKNKPKISFQKGSWFYRLVQALFIGERKMRYSIMETKILYNEYIDGDTKWWSWNTTDMYLRAMKYAELSGHGTKFDVRDPVPVFHKEAKELSFII